MPYVDERLIKESAVESYLKKEVDSLGGICVKNQRRRGWFDRSIYWYEGVADLVETKRPKGGRFEPLQERYHNKLRAMGHAVFVITTRKEVDAYIAMRLAFALPGARELRNEHLRTRRVPAKRSKVSL